MVAVGVFSCSVAAAVQARLASPTSEEPLPLDAISSQQLMADGTAPNAVILSADIHAKQGHGNDVHRHLRALKEEALAMDRKKVLSVYVSQDPEDTTRFLLTERFSSLRALKEYQATSIFNDFFETTKDLMERPVGLHIAHDREGKFSAGLYPYGPPGEGGRDDMSYAGRRQRGAEEKAARAGPV